MRLVRLSLLAGLTLLALPVVVGWTPAPQEGGGIAVVGQVTNGTPGAGFPELWPAGSCRYPVVSF